MHRFKTPLYLVLAASLLCTACVGEVTGPARKTEQTDKEFVSDVKLENGKIVVSGTALAKRAVR